MRASILLLLILLGFTGKQQHFLSSPLFVAQEHFSSLFFSSKERKPASVPFSSLPLSPQEKTGCARPLEGALLTCDGEPWRLFDNQGIF
jgi:hypothetical protein